MQVRTRKLWTVDEYHQISDTGILDPGLRTELIDGQIFFMASKKPPHSIVNQFASDYLKHLLGSRATVRTQEPIRLNNRSEPEPDIAVVIPPLRRYEDHHPTLGEIF